MVSSLQNFAENPAEKIHKIKCKYVHDNNKYEACTIKYKDFECFLQYWNVKADLIKHKYLCYNKNYPKTFVENLTKWLVNTYKFSNYETYKSILLLQIFVLPYEYMDDCGKFNETSFPKKGISYSYLNMEDITCRLHTNFI